MYVCYPCICEYIYVFMYMYLYICICICVYMCMYIYVYTYMYIYMYICSFWSRSHTYTFLYTYICICICVFMYVYWRLLQKGSWIRAAKTCRALGASEAHGPERRQQSRDRCCGLRSRVVRRVLGRTADVLEAYTFVYIHISIYMFINHTYISLYNIYNVI